MGRRARFNPFGVARGPDPAPLYGLVGQASRIGPPERSDAASSTEQDTCTCPVARKSVLAIELMAHSYNADRAAHAPGEQQPPIIHELASLFGSIQTFARMSSLSPGQKVVA